MIQDQLVATDALRDRVGELVRAGKVDLVRTHLQQDENNDTPDPDKRERLQSLELPVIPTSGFVLGVSRLGLARLSEPEPIEELRAGNQAHTNDALLGATAIESGRVLVTDDTTLRGRALARGARVWSGAELVAYLATL